MKRLMASALLFEMALSAFAEGSSEKLAWWTESRFGMFIHFGLYATPARGEWVQSRTPIAPKDYETYFEQFDPDLYDPVEWAKAAKAAGMKYVVLTAKHHEGFCLWDTKFTDYKVTNTSYGKDLLKPFVDAFRAEGLRVGFYYSLLDWHHPDYAIDVNHPLHPKDDAEWNDAKAYEPLNGGRDMAKYRQYMKDQVRELLTEFGRIDILVNNAGITRDGLMLRMEEKQWDAVLTVNLKSAFNFIHALTPVMAKQRGGSIINMSSVVGVSGNAGQCNYSASKAGLIGLTKSIAKEMGPRGIRANAIAPGFIITEMTGALPQEVRDQWVKTIPLRRGGTPEDVANVALFLASDLSSYVSGQVINCCGAMAC